MFYLYTDYQLHSPYVGQLKAVLAQHAPAWPIIDLLHDAPPFQPRLAAYLLAALWRATPVGSIIIGVVDPGVGSTRGVCWVEADGRHFIGPDNGLAYIVALHAQQCTWREVRWQPDYSSASFHGRDWFAPLAVQLAQSGSVPSEAGAVRVEPWLADTAEVIYLDSYGSAYTGIRAAQVAPTASLLWRGQSLPRVRTFSDVAQGAPLCYANSQGLLEIAVNCGSAQRELGLTLGDKLQLETQQWVGTL